MKGVKEVRCKGWESGNNDLRWGIDKYSIPRKDKVP